MNIKIGKAILLLYFIAFIYFFINIDISNKLIYTEGLNNSYFHSNYRDIYNYTTYSYECKISNRRFGDGRSILILKIVDNKFDEIIKLLKEKYDKYDYSEVSRQYYNESVCMYFKDKLNIYNGKIEFFYINKFKSRFFIDRENNYVVLLL